MRSLVLLVAGCSFSAELPSTVDVRSCADDWLYVASNFEPCADDMVLHPALTLPVGNYDYDPAAGTLTTAGGVTMLPTSGTSPRILSLAALTVENGARVRIVGDTPLVIAVHGDATIAGTLDVSARGTTAGPGGATCAAMPGADALDAPMQWAAGGGGAGGAFGTAGAPGGYGDSQPGFAKIAGGPAMDPVGDALLTPLRGGCSGGAGGQEDPSCIVDGTPGAGGGGGGALQLTVRNTLAITATAQLAANGGGGGPGVNATWSTGSHVGVGGGGGGSGGALLVEAASATIDDNAILCANGGGGGGGSHNNDNPITAGDDGACGLMPAAGGNGINASGGAGAAATTAAMTGENGSRQDDGGGGGGGGTGRIRVRVLLDPKPATFRSSPPAMID